MIYNLHVVFNLVCQLDRQPFWRIEDQPNIVCAVVVTGLNPLNLIVLELCRQAWLCAVPTKSVIEQIRSILLKRTGHASPGQ